MFFWLTPFGTRKPRSPAIVGKQAWHGEVLSPASAKLLSLKNGGENRTLVVAGKQTITLGGVKPWNPKVAVPLDSPVHTHVRIKRGATWKLAVVRNAVPAERK